MDSLLDDLISLFGVPKEKLQSGNYASSITQTKPRDLTKVADGFATKIVRKAFEYNFPELYYDLLYIGSPRGKVLVKRKQPIRFKIEWMFDE